MNRSQRFLVLFLSFWITEFIVRFVIFGSFLDGVLPGISIEGFRTHHYLIGFAVLVAALLFMLFQLKDAAYPLLGVSLGLIMDEFSYWTFRRDIYWSWPNVLAPFLAGIVLLFFLVEPETDFYALGKLKRSRMAAYFILSESLLLLLLFSHHALSSNQV